MPELMNEKTLISVIICTYNRCNSLTDTLDSILLQEISEGAEYEIIIVDNNSQDNTKNAVISYTPKSSGRLRYIFESKQGLSYARNRGIREARGDIIVFTDDDVIIRRKWLEMIMQVFREYSCDVVGGRVLPLYPRDVPSWVKTNIDLISGPIVNYNYGRKIRPYKKEKMAVFVGANMAFKKSLFNELGYFRQDIGAGMGTTGEDTEMLERCERNGKKIYYVGAAVVWHPVEKERMSLRYIAHWYQNAGRYAAMIEHERHPGMSYWFSVPRYLWKRWLIDTLGIIFSFGQRRKLLKTWRSFFRTQGMITWYLKSSAKVNYA